MRWLRDRYSRHVANMYSGGLYDHPDKLDTMWPLIVGGAIFAVIDLSLQPQDAVRWILLTLLVGPGLVWAGLLLFREIRSLPGRYRRHKGLSEGRD